VCRYTRVKLGLHHPSWRLVLVVHIDACDTQTRVTNSYDWCLDLSTICVGKMITCRWTIPGNCIARPCFFNIARELWLWKRLVWTDPHCSCSTWRPIHSYTHKSIFSRHTFLVSEFFVLQFQKCHFYNNNLRDLYSRVKLHFKKNEQLSLTVKQINAVTELESSQTALAVESAEVDAISSSGGSLLPEYSCFHDTFPAGTFMWDMPGWREADVLGLEVSLDCSQSRLARTTTRTSPILW